VKTRWTEPERTKEIIITRYRKLTYMLQVLELKIFLTNNCFAIYISLTNLQPYQQRLIVVTSNAALTNSLQLIQLHRQVQEDLKLFWFLKETHLFLANWVSLFWLLWIDSCKN